MQRRRATRAGRPYTGAFAAATLTLGLLGPGHLPLGDTSRWGASEAHAQPYYNMDVPWYTLETIYDLQSGRYLALRMKNEEKRAYDFGFSASKADFQPAALRQSGIR